MTAICRIACIFMFIFMLGTIALAKGAGGISVDAALGMPKSTIDNPDFSKAHYSGIALLGRAHIPLYEHSVFAVDLIGSLKYLDFKNGANNAIMQEYAQQIGAGPGLELRILKFVAGFESHLMVARQNTVGNFSNNLEYTMPTTSLYYGFIIPRGFLAIAVTYSTTTGQIPKDKTQFDSDSPYSESAYWIHLRYSTGFNLRDFWKALISK